MDPQLQRFAIADILGYTKTKHESEGFGGPGSVYVDNGWERNGVFLRKLPDYLNDLNAMHEAEKVLSANDLVVYAAHLTRGRPIWDVMPNDEHFPICPEAIRATAAQRAEAFLRTLNKWTDS
jgi:hypothetical protein